MLVAKAIQRHLYADFASLPSFIPTQQVADLFNFDLRCPLSDSRVASQPALVACENAIWF
jgi:hypothetical protein